MTMALELTVLRDDGVGEAPADDQFRAWAAAALDARPVSLTIRLVDEAESRRLNAAYRGKDRATNVLSFPVDLPASVLEALPARPLGDLAICAPLVATEAEAQGKPVGHHWAHLTVHGVLHLLGHDHEQVAEAEAMEALEVSLLDRLGIPDPYRPVP